MNRSASLFVLGSFVVACSAKVSHLPQPGESLSAEAFTAEAGGKGFNLAVGAHRLGASVDGIFAIGTDLFSQLAEAAFSQAGLSPAMLRRVGPKTGSGIGFTDARGENCLAVYPGANALLTAQHIGSVRQALERAGLVLAQFETGDAPVLEAFVLARRAGVRTLLNPSPYRPIDPLILQHTTILVLNQVEAVRMAEALEVHGLTVSSPARDRLAAALMERGVETVVITLGADGAHAYRKDAAPVYQPSFPVEVVDTLGAGDAFTAGFASGLVGGCSVEQSLRAAAGCGAIVCMGLGVFDALPTRAELDAFLAAHGDPVIGA
jgi:ribokinase